MAKTNNPSLKHRNYQVSETTLIKYKLMIDEWFKNEFSPIKAYKKFYPKAKDSTADVNFCRIKDIPEIKDYIEKVRAEISEKNKITINECVEMLASMARFDITELYKEDGSLKSLNEMPKAARMVIESLETDELFIGGQNVGLTKKLKLSSRRANIIELMKHLGGYEKDNSQKAPANRLIVNMSDYKKK